MNVKDPKLGWPKVWEAELLLLHPHGCQSLHWLWTPQAPAMGPNPPCSFPGPPQNWHFFSVPQCFGCCMHNGITWDTKIQMWYWERDVVNIVFCCCCCFVCFVCLFLLLSLQDSYILMGKWPQVCSGNSYQFWVLVCTTGAVFPSDYIQRVGIFAVLAKESIPWRSTVSPQISVTLNLTSAS